MFLSCRLLLPLVLIPLALISLALSPPLLGASSSKLEPGEESISRVLAMGLEGPKKAGKRGDEAEGPYKRLLIKNAMLIDGTGGPNRGPVNILIEQDRIVSIGGGHGGGRHIQADKTIDAKGHFVLPGFIDAHAHLGTPSHAPAGALTDPEYVAKLWLAHGITTVRELGSLMGLEWTLDHKRRSEKGEISAPRFAVHVAFPSSISGPAEARQWIKSVRKKGADGIKFFGAAPEVIKAAMAEAKKLGMKTAYHHAQTSVYRINALDSARMGLDSMEHWYGLPEAMFEDKTIQHYPYGYNYNNEQDRFAQAGRLWLQAAQPGSATWRATIKELKELDFTLDPTFTIYEANRDVMRAARAEWHDEYTMPYVYRAFEPNPKIHGSYFFNWTTADEIAWKKNYQRWMHFVNDYKNAGGRVTVGSDAGFIYKLYGFAYVRELELLQEAGFHPLEVLQAATLNGAQLLGMEDQIGSIEVGKKADLVIVAENPLANFKVLYGTGHQRLNHKAGKLERSKGIVYTIKDGIVYDAKKLLADVRELVKARKELEAKQAAKP